MATTPPEQDRFMDARAVGWGCLASCASRIVLTGTVLLLLPVVSRGLSKHPAAIPLWAIDLPVILDIMAHIVTGYVVAWNARFAPVRQTMIFCAAYVVLSLLEHVLYVASDRMFFASSALRTPSHLHSYVPDWSTVGSL